MPLMEGAVLPQRDGPAGSEVYSEGLLYGPDQTAITADDYRVVYHPHADPGEPEFEVYDRRTDREERRDLADTGAASHLRTRLRQLTEESRAAASEVKAAGTREFSNRVLTEKQKERLRAIGYL